MYIIASKDFEVGATNKTYDVLQQPSEVGNIDKLIIQKEPPQNIEQLLIYLGGKAVDSVPTSGLNAVFFIVGGLVLGRWLKIDKIFTYVRDLCVKQVESTERISMYTSNVADEIKILRADFQDIKQDVKKAFTTYNNDSNNTHNALAELKQSMYRLQIDIEIITKNIDKYYDDNKKGK